MAREGVYNSQNLRDGEGEGGGVRVWRGGAEGEGRRSAARVILETATVDKWRGVHLEMVRYGDR